MNQIINLTRLTDLGAEFITLAEAKTQLRVTFTDDDTEITALIKKARRHLETYLNISIVYQRIQMTAVLYHENKLPYGPVIGLESVQDNQGVITGSGPVSYSTTTTPYASDGDLFTPMAGVTGFYSNVANEPLRTSRLPAYRYKITYTAGNFCPDDLKDVMLQVVLFLYENRGRDVSIARVTAGSDRTVSPDLTALMSNADRYKCYLWI